MTTDNTLTSEFPLEITSGNTTVLNKLNPNNCVCVADASTSTLANPCVTTSCSNDETQENAVKAITIEYNSTSSAIGGTMLMAALVCTLSLTVAFFLAKLDVLGNRWRKKDAARVAGQEEEAKLMKVEGGQVANNADDDGVEKLNFAEIYAAVKEVNLAAWLVIV